MGSKNPGKIVKIIQDKNAKMSIQRSQDRWPNKYPSEYAVIAGNYITQSRRLTGPVSLMSDQMVMSMIQKMMQKRLHLVNKKKRSIQVSFLSKQKIPFLS